MGERPAIQIGGTAAVLEFTVERNDLAKPDTLLFVRRPQTLSTSGALFNTARLLPATTIGSIRLAVDVVVGPVPGDWKKQTVIPDGDQVSFHTAAAVGILNMLPANCKRRVV